MAIMIRSEWLNLTKEEIVDPKRPIIDPHLHLFKNSAFFPRYSLDDFWVDAAGHNVKQAVFVQCLEGYREDGPEELKPVGETEWVDGLSREAQRSPSKVQIKGIVGATELRLGARVREVLEAHKAASPLFKGIRQMATWDSSPEAMSLENVDEGRLYLNPVFREGFAVLQQMGLVFEAWHYHTQTPHLVSLARAHPDSSIVLNHLATPIGVGPYAGRRDEIFQDWARGIKELAACANVSIKLGGMLMPETGFGFENNARAPSSDEIVAAHRPYYELAIEAFGTKRCMFESNFPVEKIVCSYDVLWNAFKKIAAGCSDNDKHDLFYGTAASVYGLQ
jgi:predicted TIM-barrel fold metal-dependent hydrolase